MKAIHFAKSLGGAALVLCVSTSPAAAAPLCSSLPGAVYMQGATVARPEIIALDQAFATASPPTTVVFQAAGACAALSNLVMGPLMGAGQYWDATGTQQTCDFESGAVTDIAVSDLFANSCSITLPANVADFAGAVDAGVFITSPASTRTVISANAAYFVFGFGASSMVSPWVDESQMFVRTLTASPQIILGLGIGVPAARWRGTAQGSSAAVIASIAASVNPDAAIGISSVDSTDTSRDRVRALAFQKDSTSCGVLPDSSVTSFDKANVRNGTYPLWGRTHYVAKVDATGAPLKAQAANVIGILTNTRTAPAGFSAVDVEIANHLVPQCAMSVSRSTEMGALSSFTPSNSCSCYFDQKTTGASSCQACMADANCSSGHSCRRGLCE